MSGPMLLDNPPPGLPRALRLVAVASFDMERALARGGELDTETIALAAALERLLFLFRAWGVLHPLSNEEPNHADN